MNPKSIGKRKRPEQIIQEALIVYLEARDWFVKETHGNAYQSGFPDLYVCHAKYGPRWIEVKNSLAYGFTKAQLNTFPKMQAAGAGIWILVAANNTEYRKLFGPANWYHYLRF